MTDAGTSGEGASPSIEGKAPSNTYRLFVAKFTLPEDLRVFQPAAHPFESDIHLRMILGRAHGPFDHQGGVARL